MTPMPPQGAAPGARPPVPQGAGQQLPEIAKFLEPNNEMQAELLRRLDKLTPQDVAAFQKGVTPQAIAVLKKLFPEIGFILDMAVQGGGAPMTAGGPGLPPGPGAPPLPGAPAGGPPSNLRPATALSRF